jgi:hypothetical protein
MANGNGKPLGPGQLAQARQASASILGRFQGAERFDQRTVDFATPQTIQYRPFNLNRPLESIILEVRGRLAVTVGAFAAVGVEAIQNLVQRIRLEGQHRTNGNLVPLNLTGATAFALPLTAQESAGNQVYTSVGGAALTLAPRPGQPLVASFDGTVANHDFIMFLNIPLTPQMGIGSSLKRWSQAFLYMPDDWQNTLSLTLQFGDASSFGDVTGATTDFTAFGSAEGLPTVAVHLNYCILGPMENAARSQGITLRTERLLTDFVTAADEQRLLSLDKRITTGVLVKTGTIETTGITSGVTTFQTLNSLQLNRTQIMVDNKPVRNIVSDLAEKSRINRQFNVDPIEGYHALSFVDGQNPLLAYRADGLKGGAQFDLIADVLTTSADQRVTVVQEQVIGGPFPALRP